METVVIAAERRGAGGRRANQYLRKNGRVPAIIYGHKKEPEAISLPHHDLAVALGHGARMLEVQIEGSGQNVLIKDVQYDYLGVDVLHVDLTRVDLTEMVQVRVPIEYRGEPVGVHEGGQLEHHLMELEVECQTVQIPKSIRVRVDAIKLGESLYVRDVQTEPGIKIITHGDEAVCTVRPPVTAAATVEEEAAEEEGAAEPEVIGRGKEESEAEQG
ncbi:MAG: 50S ribosomal protein L25 [Phycisphaerales bacterium]|nr:MAG: 50S ribosomal protein L25 [Phycisphaerales bacterium]